MHAGKNWTEARLLEVAISATMRRAASTTQRRRNSVESSTFARRSFVEQIVAELVTAFRATGSLLTMTHLRYMSVKFRTARLRILATHCARALLARRVHPITAVCEHAR